MAYRLFRKWVYSAPFPWLPGVPTRACIPHRRVRPATLSRKTRARRKQKKTMPPNVSWGGKSQGKEGPRHPNSNEMVRGRKKRRRKDRSKRISSRSRGLLPHTRTAPRADDIAYARGGKGDRSVTPPTSNSEKEACGGEPLIGSPSKNTVSGPNGNGQSQGHLRRR